MNLIPIDRIRHAHPEKLPELRLPGERLFRTPLRGRMRAGAPS